MSVKFKDTPVDEWEKEHFAEELKEQRKRDKKERGRVSGYARSLIALLEAGGVSTDVYQAVHVFLSLTRNCAPEEPVFAFSEKDAGEKLPGKSDVAFESFRKRFIRAWSMIEHEQASTGKCFVGRREKGSIKLARKQDAKKTAPKYFSQIAQAVLDVEREASRLRGNREDCYRRAALKVWKELPAFSEDDITLRPEESRESKKPESGSGSGGKFPRRLDRFVRAAKEMLSEAKKHNSVVVEATGKELVLELGKMFAEALDVEPESALRLLADTLLEASDTPVHSNEEFSLDIRTTGQTVYDEKEEVGGTNFFEDSQKPEQKHEDEAPTVYGAVHVEPDATPGFCVACGRPIPPERQKVDSERCKQCVESEYWRTAPLRAVKPPEERLL